MVRLRGVRLVVTSVEHVEIPRGGGSGVRVHQAQVARHRHHVAVSAGVHGGRGGGSGGGGVALVVGPEHAHGRRRADGSRRKERRTSGRRFLVNGQAGGRTDGCGSDAKSRTVNYNARDTCSNNKNKNSVYNMGKKERICF